MDSTIECYRFPATISRLGARKGAECGIAEIGGIRNYCQANQWRITSSSSSYAEARTLSSVRGALRSKYVATFFFFCNSLCHIVFLSLNTRSLFPKFIYHGSCDDACHGTHPRPPLLAHSSNVPAPNRGPDARLSVPVVPPSVHFSSRTGTGFLAHEDICTTRPAVRRLRPWPSVTYGGFSCAVPCPRPMTFGTCRPTVHALLLQPHSYWFPGEWRNLNDPLCNSNPCLDIRSPSRSVQPA
ncbi:uncharacterized protein LOC142583600 [Dermacentor variabilis]|uniref:uncharacterized protein LOC142583600 n=1 Tax=Dermacentor variabilis TaxID=34621 RepID=UPI003F5CB74C